MNFRIAENLSQNEGQRTGLFVVQIPFRTPHVVIDEGLEHLQGLKTPDLNTVIPIITDECYMSGSLDYLRNAPALGLGGLATFGTDGGVRAGSGERQKHGKLLRKNISHLGIFARGHGADDPDFLVPLLKLPPEVRKSRQDLYSRLTRFHLKAGTMTVKGGECKLELLDEL